MRARPHDNHCHLMLVLAALFAFVTVGFNAASYADGPRLIRAAQAISVSIDVVVHKVASSDHIRVPRHLAHQPQILPAPAVAPVQLSPVGQGWPSPRSGLAESHVFTHLLRPPKLRAA